MTYRLVDSPVAVKEALGMTDDHVVAIREAMNRGLDGAAKLIPDEWVEPFVIMGSTDECAAELRGLAELHEFDEFALVVADMNGAATLLTEVADVLGLV
jgi:alkanesulfonate monooxygenase SsuD/methylene tetrahydromethanopterin reductase-like flavin-dependent oxidoreductase (luciferase family)